ncbi:Rad4-domain-containing protein [Neurospora crassa]|uniref:Rad4 family protein n=1 Tax=Neurospora crassa (strain ATCC 24698 / 74-OR23-1A / CBS 708.71 / DSM 1257 / FGSC 987) TaxID=367110 RepID=Q7S8M9_NEUCR|nr:Rad4 family protein [Neurospora crassa OR74A]EAA32709.1 Rad4 family protein [Neurospora crassa OR74A]KHE84035.1 Rad4-domain-containing protein [Neurospora crassa]|eukprot:XP_961945.1 Rad4 family protein [Neurospora crassa OR74A]
MPPYVPRKRVRDESPPPANDLKNDAKRRKGKENLNAAKLSAPPRKPTLFDALDATASPASSSKTSLAALALDESSDDDSSSLSSLSDGDFEDVPVLKKQKHNVQVGEDEDEDDDEDLEFEDVEPYQPQSTTANVPEVPAGDLELTLIRDTRISLANALGKKGPSKLERRIRVSTHCVHVQLLLWHNAVRNAWLCDPEVQGILLSHLPPKLWDEVDRWRRNSGLEVVVPDGGGTEASTKKKSPAQKKTRAQVKGKAQAKGKDAAKADRSRDWGQAAKHLEKGAVDMSHGDPLFRLMKVLSAWWKQRFRTTAPGLRKWGYMTLERLDRLTKAFNQEEHQPERFGERIASLEDFRECASECAGSRDVGAQLFTAMLRALGLEARLVASLQPLGFGWTKVEEADPEKEEDLKPTPKKNMGATSMAKETVTTHASGRSTRRGASRKATKIQRSNSELIAADSDDDLVISDHEPEPTPRMKNKVYDKDLEFPHYWTEVLSPVTKKYLPVDPIVKSIIGTNRELIESLEPRGSKADKAKQVMAYVMGYSPDGTAKDVTVRYLKRQTLPGRTKGMRIPMEKVPVYNKHGKVARYEMYDWFQTVMKGYARGGRSKPAMTDVDLEENATDLKPAKPEKKEVKEGQETLQYYKQSKEFVLERHLKREEALLPNARPVKMFRNKGSSGGSSKKAATTTAATQDEPVYSRKDVVHVKSAETWHKQGRAPLPGEQPLKRVPYRAATNNRRREIAEAERLTGQKVLQGLYSFDQTDWIIPPPIENGVIPKNEYGNIDLFAEHMCPQGAVHVPYRGAMRVCKRLGIDYAEAVVDFEFGNRMAVPVVQGVVIAEEHHDQVMEEVAKDEAEKKRKEDEKRRKAALGMWRKLLMGMRIVERIKQDYGHVGDEVEVFGRHGSGGADIRELSDAEAEMGEDEETGGGGFLPEGFEVEDEERDSHLRSSFFPVVDEDDEDGEDTLEVDHGEGEGNGDQAERKKESAVMSTKPKRKAAAAKAKASIPGSRRRTRRNVPSSEDEDEEEDEDSELSDLEDDEEDF